MVIKKKTLQLALLASATAATIYTVAPWVNATRHRAGVVHMESGSASKASATPSKAIANANEIAPDGEVLHAPSKISRVVPDSQGEAFINLSWVPPAPPAVTAPPQVLPSPAPTAPPLPFTFVGLLEKGADHPVAFVAKGDVLLVVAAGDTIDGDTYRVETLGAQKIVVTYLPMGIQQTLNLIGTSQ